MLFCRSRVWQVVVGLLLVLASSGGLALAVCNWYDCSWVHATGRGFSGGGFGPCEYTLRERGFTGLAQSDDGKLWIRTTITAYNASCSDLCTELPAGEIEEMQLASLGEEKGEISRQWCGSNL